MATFPVSGSVRFLPRAKVSEPTDVGERKGYEEKRAIAEGRELRKNIVKGYLRVRWQLVSVVMA